MPAGKRTCILIDAFRGSRVFAVVESRLALSMPTGLSQLKPRTSNGALIERSNKRTRLRQLRVHPIVDLVYLGAG